MKQYMARTALKNCYEEYRAPSKALLRDAYEEWLAEIRAERAALAGEMAKLTADMARVLSELFTVEASPEEISAREPAAKWRMLGSKDKGGR